MLSETWKEAYLLSTTQRDLFIESALVDYFLATEAIKTVNSLQDCRLFVEKTIKDLFEITDSGKITGVQNRLTVKTWVCWSTNKDDSEVSIRDLIKGIRSSLKFKSPVFDTYTKDGKKHILLEVPDVDLNDEDNVKILTSLITLGCYTHGVEADNFRLVKSKDHGTGKLVLSNSNKKLLDALVSSAKHPLGVYVGERFKFNERCECNLVEMLGLMRILNLKSEVVRRNKSYTSLSITYNMVVERFNKIAQFKGDTVTSYTQKVLRAILSSCVKPNNKSFPGGWIHSTRRANKVKSDLALLLSIGWYPKVPSPSIISEVLFNTVDPTDKPKEYKPVNIIKDRRQFTFPEFRTAVALTLPRIDTSIVDREEIQRQLDADCLKPVSAQVCRNFVEAKRDLLTDQLIKSYTFKVSEKDPKKKTKLVHYKQARETLLHASAGIPLVDAKGTHFNKFSDIPEFHQKMLREKYRYALKRAREAEGTKTPGQNAGTTMEVDNPETPARKKQKLTPGQAKDAVRRSGRLAQLSN
jgi:hypothetical protein